MSCKNRLNRRRQSGRRRPLRNGYALYVGVMFTALLVSLLGLSGLTLVRVERQEAAEVVDSVVAHHHARSAVELALLEIANDSDWRSTYANGQETTLQALGPSSVGTLSWVLEDSDGSLTDNDVELRLKGVGRVGNVVQVKSIEIEEGNAEVGPAELRSQTSTLDQADGLLSKTLWWCQYLKVALPPEATGWKVTSVELYIGKSNGNRDFNLRLYQPLPNNMPSSTLLDSVDLNSNMYSPTMQWRTISMSGEYSIAPNDGVCIALETTANKDPIKLRYRSSGVVETDSALITGDTAWNTYDSAQAFLYRVHGVYETSSGVQPIMGTWVRDAAP